MGPTAGIFFRLCGYDRGQAVNGHLKITLMNSNDLSEVNTDHGESEDI